MLRGTISELLPGDSVTIVTVTGQTRQFRAAEVDYAGPTAKDPGASASAPAPAAVSPAAAPAAAPPSSNGSVEPYVTVTGKRANVRLVSDPPGLTFHRASSSAVAVGPGGVAVARGFERLCTAPCSISLPAGTETLALSQDDGLPRAADPIAIPEGNSQIDGHLESRAGVRTAGWVIALGSAVVGSVLMIKSRSTSQDCSDAFLGCQTKDDLDVGMLVGGAAVLSIGVGVGVGMAFIGDVAQVEQRQAGVKLPRAPGLALTGAF